MELPWGRALLVVAEMTAPIIGIDLGTTNCCAAWVTPQGEVRLIPYRGGEYTMPSVFALTDKHQEIVGYEAKRQAQLNPQGTVKGAKRIIGLPFEHEVVQRMREYADFSLVEASRRGNNAKHLRQVARFVAP